MRPVRYRMCFADHEFALPPGESIVGRDAMSRVRLGHPSVSRRHARLLVVGDVVTIEDLGSKNGLTVNSSHASGPTRIIDGDRVRVGSIEFTLREDSAFEVEEITGVDDGYRAPIYRTCPACRGLLERDDGKCPHCGASQNTAPHKIVSYRDPVGRRAAFRAGVKLRGLYVSPTLTLDGEVSDLSLGGAFFRCELLDPVGSACDLLVFKDADEVFRFGAAVARVSAGGQRDEKKPRTGLGLRFTRMSAPAERWLLSIAEPPA